MLFSWKLFNSYLTLSKHKHKNYLKNILANTTKKQNHIKNNSNIFAITSRCSSRCFISQAQQHMFFTIFVDIIALHDLNCYNKVLFNFFFSIWNFKIWIYKWMFRVFFIFYFIKMCDNDIFLRFFFELIPSYIPHQRYNHPQPSYIVKIKYMCVLPCKVPCE